MLWNCVKKKKVVLWNVKCRGRETPPLLFTPLEKENLLQNLLSFFSPPKRPRFLTFTLLLLYYSVSLSLFLVLFWGEREWERVQEKGRMDSRTQYNPRTVEEVFRDFKGRRAGLIKALTTGSTLPFQMGHDATNFFPIFLF